MPVDPSISLGVVPPKSPLGDNPLGALSTLQGIANTQQEMQARGLQMQQYQNQIQQFQAQFGGMQEAGRIISQAPDWDSALAGIKNSPNAGFMLDSANKIREQLNTAAQMNLANKEAGRAQAGTAEAYTAAGLNVAKTTETGVGIAQGLQNGATKALLGAVGQPEQAPLLMQQYVATLPPEVQKQYGPVFKSMVDTVMPPYGMPPDKADEYYRTKIAGKIMATGMSDVLPKLLPTPSFQEMPKQGPVVSQLPPVVPLAGGGPAGQGAGGPAGQGAGAGAAPRTGTANPSTIPPSTTAPTPTAAPAGLAVPPGPGPTAPQGQGAGLTGTNVMAPAQFDENTKILEKHSSEEHDAYEQAQTATASLGELDKSLALMAKNGGFLQPGFGDPARLAFANAVNTMAAASGYKLPFDPKTVAAGELANKLNLMLGATSGKALLAGQKEAAQTIESLTSTIPGISNTPLGARILVSAWQALLQRTKDEWEFVENWKNQRQGNALGAQAYFNQQRPPEFYTQQVTKNYGLNPDGSWTEEGLGKAYQQGLLGDPKDPKTRDKVNKIIDTLPKGQ